MYLPIELDPQDATIYAVVIKVRSTGARQIEHIVTDPDQARRLAEINHGFVLEIKNVADYR